MGPLTPVPAGRTAPAHADVEALARFVERHPRLFVLTGAGCSTDSGIPDYRDADGAWKHRQPMYYQEFVGHESARRRYWARSLTGWERVARARPNAAHAALARLETAGFVHTLVTQNVDGLHQCAGSRAVIDLHGRLDAVECLGCGARTARSALQERLRALNPGWSDAAAPDGDALLERDFADFRVPPCESCGGVLKPAVVFFGECVPAERVAGALAALAVCDALLVVGLVADGVLGLPLLPRGIRARRAAGRGQSRPHARGRRARAESTRALRRDPARAGRAPRAVAHSSHE